MLGDTQRGSEPLFPGVNWGQRVTCKLGFEKLVGFQETTKLEWGILESGSCLLAKVQEYEETRDVQGRQVAWLAEE